MIYLFSAIYPEAKTCISSLHLKQEMIVKGYQSFVSEESILTLTGVGKVSAASTISSILAKTNADKNDFIVFFGSCASLRKGMDKKLYQISKITDFETGRSFYPDLLYKTNCEKVPTLTGSLIYGFSTRRDIPEIVDLKKELQKEIYKEYGFYDMESSAVYQSASKFVDADHILIFRFPSDEGEKITREDLEKESSIATKELLSILEWIKDVPKQKEEIFSKEENEIIQKFIDKLHCTVTMANELKQYIRFAKLSGKDWQSILQRPLMEVSDKEEGKKVLREYEEQLLQ